MFILQQGRGARRADGALRFLPVLDLTGFQLLALSNGLPWSGQVRIYAGGQTPCSVGSLDLAWSFSSLQAPRCVSSAKGSGFLIQSINATALTGAWCAGSCSGFSSCDSLGYSDAFPSGTVLATNACTVSSTLASYSVRWAPITVSGTLSFFSSSICSYPAATYTFRGLSVGACIRPHALLVEVICVRAAGGHFSDCF